MNVLFCQILFRAISLFIVLPHGILLIIVVTNMPIVENDAIHSWTTRIPRLAWIFLKTMFAQLKRQKPMGQIQEEIDTQNTLERTLNWVQLTAIGLGGIIGN